MKFKVCLHLVIIGVLFQQLAADKAEWSSISYHKPQVDTTPGYQTKLYCEAVGTPPPLLIWFNGTRQSISNGDHNLDESKDVNAIARSVAVMPINDYTGNRLFTCVAKSGKSVQFATTSVQQTTSLMSFLATRQRIVLDKIIGFTNYHSVIMTGMGKRVVLPCRTFGIPAPKRLWYDAHDRLINAGRKRYQITELGDLIITKIELRDTGPFTCMAKNAAQIELITTFVLPVYTKISVQPTKRGHLRFERTSRKPTTVFSNLGR